MRNAALAEWVLSLVMVPERAAATTGDLLEQETSPSRFWSSITWTVLSLTWSDLSTEPLGTVRLALVAFLIAIVISALFGGAAGLIFGTLLTKAPGISVNELIPIALAISWASSLTAGIVLAHGAKGRELAACVVFLLIEVVVSMGTSHWDRPDARPEGWYSSALATVVFFVVGELFMVAGAMRVRLRRLRAA
ncbi:MAG TPA: hypothetical protein VNZ26_15560 [Vicinamibacterales bacterium]|jgi:hypothetical protein|nr:hypothetical protein [Vicinamibacterales bacterium]